MTKILLKHQNRIVLLLLLLTGLFVIYSILFSGTKANHSPVSELEITDVKTFWSDRHFAEMIAPIQNPSNPNKNDIISVLLKVPDGELIDVQYLKEQNRYTLNYPVGTIADRIETWIRGNESWIIDVRGTRVDHYPNQSFHVYIPFDIHLPQKKMHGNEWIRVEKYPNETAAWNLIKKLRHSKAVLASLTSEEKAYQEIYIRNFKALNNCVSCHSYNSEQLKLVHPYLPPRATDAQGFYQILAVLENTSPLSRSRPWDLNTGSKFFSAWCGTKLAKLNQKAHQYQYYTCDNNEVPMGKFDMKAAVAARDPHAERVCNSRKYLYEHMNNEARSFFKSSFLECGFNE